VAAGGQEPHQGPLGLLVERFELEHAAGGLDPGGGVAAVAGVLDGPLEQGQLVAQGGGPAALGPLVEQLGPGSLEPAQELPPAQPGRGQQLGALGPAGGQPLDLDRVHPDRPGRVEGHRLPGHQQLLGQDPAELGQGQAQVGPGGRLGQVAPEQPGQGRARLRRARHRQVHEQRRRLGRCQPDQWAPVHGQLGRAEHTDAKLLPQSSPLPSSAGTLPRPAGRTRRGNGRKTVPA
jgi:hypothetical protein